MGRVRLIAGTPAGSPAAPAEPSNAFTLAIIDIPAGDTTIGNAQITDSRTLYADIKKDILRSLRRAGSIQTIPTATGTGNAIAVSNAQPVTAYQSGLLVTFRAIATNTTAVTINVDGLGTKDIKKCRAGAFVDLEADDITSGAVIIAQYDGTRFQLLTAACWCCFDCRCDEHDRVLRKGLRYATGVWHGDRSS